MRLILRIASPTSDVVPVAHTFTEEGGTIGRAAASSWVLPHSNVSGRHAVISFRDGQFYIQDASRNGVAINSPDNRLVRHRSYPLKAGDVIFIEPYKIEIFVETRSERQAVGLPSAQVTPELANEFGQMLRVVVAGLMDLIHSCWHIKEEFRMRQTAFDPATNNPLKFSADVEDALHNLLVKRNPAYLGAVDAFAEAFDDLRDHQLAMLTGMRVAFEAMRAEFDPDGVHLEMGKGREDAFAHFGEEFARAYEVQFQELRAQRRARGEETPQAPAMPIPAGYDPLSADAIAPPEADTDGPTDNRQPIPTDYDPLSDAFCPPPKQVNIPADAAAAAALQQARERARAALEEARQALRAGSFDRAIRLLEKVRGLDPSLSTDSEAELMAAGETSAECARDMREAATTKARKQDTVKCSMFAPACPSLKLGDGRPFTLCDRLRVERACATTSLTASDGAILADAKSERR